MPINPNIILQAGKGVTPINRLDPMREAAFGVQIQNNQAKQNALRDKRQQEADKQHAARVYAELGNADAEGYAAIYQREVQQDPEAANVLPPPDQFSPDVIEQVRGIMKSKFLDGEAIVTDERARTSAAATAKHRQDTLSLGKERNEIARKRANRSGPSYVPKASGKTILYRNGTSVQVRTNGTVAVTDPTGAEVSGLDRNRVLEAARRSGVADQAERAQARGAATEGVKQLSEYSDQLDSIRNNVRNLDSAIKAIDDGANTGPMMSMLPSVSQASVALDNIQRSLGLDVVGDTTFGALSKGELDLALATALPTDMRPQELKKWVIAKRNAQAKLGNWLKGAISYLSQPGATMGGWQTGQKDIEQRLPDDVTEEDIAETMRIHNMTRDEVLERLNGG